MTSSRKPPLEPDEPTSPSGAVLGQPAEEPVPLGGAPEADEVAARAVMIAALLERAKLESAPSESHLAALRAWVDDQGVIGNLGADGLRLFEAAQGSWGDEDVEAVDWTSEELALLLWALGKHHFPGVGVRAEAAPLLAKVPLLAGCDPFITGARLRTLEELEVHAALADALLEVIRAEASARSLQEDASGLDGDEDLAQLLAAVEVEGFDRQAAAAKGKANEAIQGLRFWSRSLLGELFGPESPHLAHRIDSAQLVGLDDATLATWLGIAYARAEAMAWLLEGDELEA